MNTQNSASAPAVRDRGLLVNGSSLLAVFALTALLISSPITSAKMQTFDDSARELIGAAPGDASYQWFLPVALQHIGSTLGATILCAVLVLLCLLFKRWWHALYAGLSLALIGGVFNHLLKAVFDRERPQADEAAGLYGSIYPTSSPAFPSGHSTAAAVFAVMFVVLTPIVWTKLRRAIPYIGIAFTILMMIQRVLTNAHWLTDTIAGATFGAGCALLLWYFMQPQLDAEQRKFALDPKA